VQGPGESGKGVATLRGKRPKELKKTKNILSHAQGRARREISTRSRKSTGYEKAVGVVPGRVAKSTGEE